MTNIFIDPGHGGSDAGASGHGLSEKEITLDIALKVRDILKTNHTGHSVKMSRTTDETVSLDARTNMANEWGADCLLSIHINSGGGTGFESYIYNASFPGKDRTDALRGAVHKGIIDQTDLSDRGQKEANFHMLRESAMPAVLTENGFFDRKQDAERLKRADFLDAIARGHAKGLEEAFDLKKKSDEKSSDKQKYIEILAESLWTYHTADWDERAATVHKGDVFTVKRDKFPVGDGAMYQIKSGLYVTANTDYVRAYTD